MKNMIKFESYLKLTCIIVILCYSEKVIYAFYTDTVQKDELCILFDRDTEENEVTKVKKKLIALYDDPDKIEEKIFSVPNLSIFV